MDVSRHICKTHPPFEIRTKFFVLEKLVEAFVVRIDQLKIISMIHALLLSEDGLRLIEDEASMNCLYREIWVRILNSK